MTRRRPQRTGRPQERPACAPAKRVRHFPGLPAFQWKCEQALSRRGQTPRQDVQVTLNYHGQVKAGTRLLLVAEPHRVYATALHYDPAQQVTVCTISALAVLQAASHASGGLKPTKARPEASKRHPPEGSPAPHLPAFPSPRRPHDHS